MKCVEVVQFVGPYLDSELDTTTTFQIQAHLAKCPSCHARYEQEHDLERKISNSLRGVHDTGNDVRWMQILERALPQQSVRQRKRVPMWIHMGSVNSHWISLVASLVFLAALACAGLGLRHGSSIVIPQEIIPGLDTTA